MEGGAGELAQFAELGVAHSSGWFRGGSVVVVAHQWVARFAQVDSDLVGSTGVNSDREQGAGGKTLAQLDFAQCRLGPVSSARYLRPVVAVTPDSAIDPELVRGHAVDDTKIVFLHDALLEFGHQAAMGTVAFGDDDNASRSDVESVNDTGALHAPDAAQVVAVGQECVDQRPCWVTGRRVNDHARRLVDDDEIFVLKHDREWDVFRLGYRPNWRRNRDFNRLPLATKSRRAPRVAINAYESVIDPFPDLSPADVLELIRHSDVQPQADFFCADAPRPRGGCLFFDYQADLVPVPVLDCASTVLFSRFATKLTLYGFEVVGAA